jgi:hypothetical protein
VERRVIEHIRPRASRSSSHPTCRCRTSSGAGPSGSSSDTVTIPRRRRRTCRSRGASSRSSSGPTTGRRRSWCRRRGGVPLWALHGPPRPPHDRRALRERQQPAAQSQRAPPAGPRLPGDPHHRPAPGGARRVAGDRGTGRSSVEIRSPRSVGVGFQRRKPGWRPSWPSHPKSRSQTRTPRFHLTGRSTVLDSLGGSPRRSGDRGTFSRCTHVPIARWLGSVCTGRWGCSVR